MSKKIVVINGIHGNVGRKLIKALPEQGYCVCAIMNPAEISEGDNFTETETFLPVLADVAKESEVIQALERVIEKYQGYDVLINNYEKQQAGMIEEVSASQVQDAFRTNVYSVINMIRVFLPCFRKKRQGHIINISSCEGFKTHAGNGIYGATKYAIEGLSISLSKELAPLNIKVTDVKTWDGFYTNAVKSVGMIQRLLEMEQPPVHLFAGSDAMRIAEEKLEFIENELKQHKELSESVDINSRYRDMDEIKKWSLEDEQ